MVCADYPGTLLKAPLKFMIPLLLFGYMRVLDLHEVNCRRLSLQFYKFSVLVFFSFTQIFIVYNFCIVCITSCRVVCCKVVYELCTTCI